MGEKKRETIFPEKHEYCQLEILEKYRLKKVRKHYYYIHTKIVTKNGGKTREIIFPETHE